MAAVDFFLKIDGIPGESTDFAHKGEIQVASWSWGETNSGHATATGAGGATAGRVSVQDFHFTSKISKASPKLMAASVGGTIIKEAVLTAVRRGAEDKGDFPFLKYTMDTILVSGVAQAANPNDLIPEDTVSLNFAKIAVEYKEQKQDGTLGETVTFTFNVRQQRAG